MNQDINIVLPAADTLANALQFIDGLGGAYKNAGADLAYSFPWKKLGRVSKTAAAAAVVSDIKFTPSAVSDGSVHSFLITQRIGDDIRTLPVSYTANAADTIATVCDQLIVILTALDASGAIDVATTDNATDIDIAGTADAAVLTIAGAQGGTLTVNAAGSYAVGQGADLLAEGIVDSFDGDLPVTGISYSEYRLELMAPKGHGGFNGQTSDQEHVLYMYADEAAAGFAALDAVVDSVIDGSYTAAELLGSNV